MLHQCKLIRLVCEGEIERVNIQHTYIQREIDKTIVV